MKKHDDVHSYIFHTNSAIMNKPNSSQVNPMTDINDLTLEERKTIYRARRGLKELDIYFDPYVKHHYLTAEPNEKALFAELIEQEDPDLLDWFMEVSEPPRPELKHFILKLKALLHGE